MSWIVILNCNETRNEEENWKIKRWNLVGMFSTKNETLVESCDLIEESLDFGWLFIDLRFLFLFFLQIKTILLLATCHFFSSTDATYSIAFFLFPVHELQIECEKLFSSWTSIYICENALNWKWAVTGTKVVEWNEKFNQLKMVQLSVFIFTLQTLQTHSEVAFFAAAFKMSFFTPNPLRTPHGEVDLKVLRSSMCQLEWREIIQEVLLFVRSSELIILNLIYRGAAFKQIHSTDWVIALITDMR